MSRHSLLSSLVALVAALAAPALVAQGGVEGPFTVEVDGPWFADVDVRDLPTIEPWQPGDPIFEIPEGGLPVSVEQETPLAADVSPGLPGVAGELGGGADPFLVNVEGIAFTGVSPPDTVGDVGPNHYIQMTNQAGGSAVLILDKSGTILAGPFNLDTLWTAGGACASGLGDPIVVYDGLADRWLLSEFAANGNHLCIYISQTPDPVAGGWFLYDFPTPTFPDYPKYAVWPDAYYVSTFDTSGLLRNYALNRSQMLAGLPADPAIGFSIPALNEAPRSTRLLPSHLESPDAPPAGVPNFYFRTVEEDQDPGNPTDRIEIYEFLVDFAVPGDSSFTLTDSIPLADFSFPDCSDPVPPRSCVPQPNTGNKVDALPGRPIMQNGLRYDPDVGTLTMLDTESEDAGGGIWAQRWWRLEKSTAAEGAPWVVAEEGQHAPDPVHRWMGSVAMNGLGQIALGYSVSDATSVFPGIRVAGRDADDPPGAMTWGEFTVIDGTGSQTGSQRWGDYSAMAVDPSDETTFWYTQEYIVAGGQWRTRVAAFRLDAFFADGFESGDTSGWDQTVD